MSKSSEIYESIIGLIFVVLAIGGWIANIVKIVTCDSVDGFIIMRVIGVFMAPIGMILGYF